MCWNTPGARLIPHTASKKEGMNKTNPPQDPSPSQGNLTDLYGKLVGKMALGESRQPASVPSPG